MDESYGDPGQEVDTAGADFVTALASVLTHLASLAPGRPNRVALVEFMAYHRQLIGNQKADSGIKMLETA